MKEVGFDLNDLELAALIDNDENSLNFYKQETIQHLIDFQWQKSIRFTYVIMRIYYILFVFPFVFYCLLIKEMKWPFAIPHELAEANK